MKHLFLFFLLLASLFAEPSFNDIQKLIDNHQYKQAKFALQLVVANHPSSAKAYYTLAQANAGLGDLPTANENLLRAKALDPQLTFASSSAIASLEQAITPQTHLIHSVESSNFWWFVLFFSLSAGVVIYIWSSSSKVYTSTTPTPSSKYDSPTYTSSCSTPSTEVHHYHDSSNSSMSTLGTIAVAAGTATVVSSLVSDQPTHHYDEQPTHSYQPDPISSSWDEPTTKSSSWDSSSSSSSSWDSSSSSSSDSSWD